MSRDERDLRIIKEMAYGRLQDYDGTLTCLHCSNPYVVWVTWENTYHVSEVPHNADCAVVEARQIMKELGTPLCEYEVSLERWWYSETWKPQTLYVAAFSEQEALAHFPANEEAETNVLPKHRQVHIQAVREIVTIIGA